MKSSLKSNLNLLVVGFGCCRQEMYAAEGPLYDIQRFGVNFVNLPENADVLVIYGFFNKIWMKRVLDMYERMSYPKWTLAVGKCILSESLFGCDTKLFRKFKDRLNIEVHIPGCPPRPEAFIYGILRLMDKI